MSSQPSESGLEPGTDAAGFRSRLIRTGRLVPLIAVPAIAAFVIREVLAGRFSGAALDLSRAALSWIGVAIGFEVLSYLAYAAGQRRPLGRSARGIRIRWLVSLALCALGVSNFVPAGYVMANLLRSRRFRRSRRG